MAVSLSCQRSCHSVTVIVTHAFLSCCDHVDYYTLSCYTVVLTLSAHCHAFLSVRASALLSHSLTIMDVDIVMSDHLE